MIGHKSPSRFSVKAALGALDLVLIAFFSVLLLLCGILAVLTRTWVKKKV